MVLDREEDGEVRLSFRIVAGLVAVAAVPLLAVLVFFASQSESGEEEAGSAVQDEFPVFVYSSQRNVNAYRLATERPDLFARIPCFCGCANLPEDEHKSLLDCFVNEDGTFDEHASACAICINIALDAAKWQDQGSSVAEVREGIDERYGDSGPATDTPPVSP